MAGSPLSDMKTDSRNTSSPLKESGPRVTPAPPSAPASALTTDLEAELLALAQEEESLQRRKTEIRQNYWDATIAALTRSIDQLTAQGFDRPTIAKALGFGPNGKSSPATKRGTGPTTHDGWYALFLTAGIRSYLKSHPDLAATLKSQKVSPADYGKHLPESDRTTLMATARQKAESKCPASRSAEVSSK